MENNILEIFGEIPLFRGADKNLVASAISDKIDIRTYRAGEEILPHENNENHIVILLEGVARVFSLDSERSVLLRTLTRGDIFGVAELFGGGEMSISRVEAKCKCRVFFLPESKMRFFLEQDKQIMYNYLDFLCCRIRFLNKRIACFTAGSAERRLAFYLDSLAGDGERKERDVRVTCEVSMGALALMLDIGRASLYRAFDTLSAEGFIKKDGKSFIILDREKMLKNYNK